MEKGLKQLKFEAGMTTGTGRCNINELMSYIKEDMFKKPYKFPTEAETQQLLTSASSKLKENGTPRKKGDSLRPIGGW